MVAVSPEDPPQQEPALAIDWDNIIDGIDPNDPNYKHLEALKKLEHIKLPPGWKKTNSTPPFVHEDGRVSWKNPAREEIMRVAAEADNQQSDNWNEQKKLEKYRRMLKNGVPLKAVEQTASMDGVDLSALSFDDATVSAATPKCSPSNTLGSSEDRYLKKYRRMQKLGVPLEGVKATARRDGFDPDSLDLDNTSNDVPKAPKRLSPNISPGRKEFLGKKYKKMIKAGVAPQAVKSMMQRDFKGEEVPQDLLNSVMGTASDEGDEKGETKQLFVTKEGAVEFPLGTVGKESHLALLVRKMVLTVKGGRILHRDKTLTVESKDLYDALGGLRGVQVARDLYNSTCSDNAQMSETEISSKRKPMIELLNSLGIRAPTRRQDAVDIEGLDDLVKYTQEIHQTQLDAIQDLLTVGMYDFNSLSEIYKPGTRMLAKSVFASGVDMICEVSWSRYEQGKTLFGTSRFFKVCFQFMVAVGKHFTLCEYVHGMESFEGRRSIQTALDFVPLFAIKGSDKLQEIFSQRGKIYERCAINASFMSYDKGSFYARSTSRRVGGGGEQTAALHTGGRIMIDTQGSYDSGYSLSIASNDLVITGIKYKYKEYMLHMRKVQQNAKTDTKHVDENDMILFDEIPADYLSMTWPALVGFSFTSKTWGEVIVDGLSDIDFNESIFDNLVLPESRKRMVKALVRHSSDSFQDIVAGKGEGSVFLLYGPPGCGKTLTAEATAELLHRPLYSVALGQLGITPTELETRLSEILDLCRRWDALILLDEADIFLEKRSSSGSLERNALVSVMLRLVEYFKGVLFLTSNRVDVLDPAFKTRITLGLRYEALGMDARKQVWTNLLAASGYGKVLAPGSDPGLSLIDVNELAKHELNGREIKNAIRLSMALAKEDGIALNQKLILETIDTLNDFNDKMTSAEAY